MIILDVLFFILFALGIVLIGLFFYKEKKDKYWSIDSRDNFVYGMTFCFSLSKIMKIIRLAITTNMDIPTLVVFVLTSILTFIFLYFSFTIVLERDLDSLSEENEKLKERIASFEKRKNL
ncbi:MAG: hypothetical protein ACOX0R_00200 [Candidatus Dojkabacteria bacterium]